MSKDLFDWSGNDAQFSDDGKYRFVLSRRWNTIRPRIMYIGLNPSTATETKDDPTIRRLTIFTHSFGYGGFYMLNLFTFITAYPERLLNESNPANLADYYLEKYAKISDKIVFCWGSFKEAKQRAEEVKKMFLDAYVFGLNSDGSPKHPLYLPKTTQLVKL